MRNATFFTLTTTLALALTAAAGAADIVAPGAELRTLDEGLAFGEGPAEGPDGALYFTDIPNELIKRIAPDGTVSVAREQSGRANGLMFDKDGALYACEMGGRRISKGTPEGPAETVADRCDGKRFNQPNDLWLDGHGGLYLTDPIYGEVNGAEEAGGRHVYYIGPDGTVVKAADGFTNPNGIVGTPDGKTLYVADLGGKVTYAFDIGPDGALSKRRKVIDAGSDGMTLDAEGRLYLTGGEGVTVYTPDGTLVATIKTPQGATNVTFGGPEGATLYITCPSAVHAIETTTHGAKKPWE